MPQSPLILVTNDDGIRSPGLLAAAEAVVGLGDLLLVAPSTQQTSMSRAFTHDARAGVIERVDLAVGGCAVPAYAVSGSPALVVTHAVKAGSGNSTLGMRWYELRTPGTTPTRIPKARWRVGSA